MTADRFDEMVAALIAKHGDRLSISDAALANALRELAAAEREAGAADMRERAAKLGDDIIDVIKQVIEMHRENGHAKGVETASKRLDQLVAYIAAIRSLPLTTPKET